MGIGFALSPQLTLSSQVNLLKTGDVSVSGATLDLSTSVITFGQGLTVVLEKNSFLEFSLIIGLTEESPDASIGLAYINRL